MSVRHCSRARCPRNQELRDRLKAVPATEGDVSTNVLGDWFATALFWRPQAALLVNQRTFVPVFMPLAPAATLLEGRRTDAAILIEHRQQPDARA